MLLINDRVDSEQYLGDQGQSFDDQYLGDQGQSFDDQQEPHESFDQGRYTFKTIYHMHVSTLTTLVKS